jgi:RNA-directed DNA polymerase
MRGWQKRRPPGQGVERGGAQGHIPPRQSGQTSLWSCVTRALAQPLEARRQRTAVPPTGARSPPAAAWPTLAGYTGHRTVRRLQARLVKAVQGGRWGQVRALPHLLPHAWSGTALAVKRVTSHDGTRTPGVDGVLGDTPEKKACAMRKVRPRGYHAQPLRRSDRPKNGRPHRLRPLSMPTMPARAMPALSVRALAPMAATQGDPHS